MKLKLIFSAEIDIDEDDLENYNAITFDEAIENMKKWMKDGTLGAFDFVDTMDFVSIEEKK